jgi:hypothetical protein
MDTILAGVNDGGEVGCQARGTGWLPRRVRRVLIVIGAASP